MCDPKPADVLFVFGTRPEAIKLCPVVLQLRKAYPRLRVKVCVTGQHRELLDQALGVFDVKPEIDLDCMRPQQTLTESTARILFALEPVLARERPRLVVVQGDTTTTLCASLSAFYAGIPVAHVEAGLRTGDLAHPFPEELNRVVAGRIAALHFAATPWAAENLRNEGVHGDAILVTGNTSIDAVLYVREGLAAGRWSEVRRVPLETGRRLLLVTAHRRESFGPRFQQICDALVELAARPDVQIVYPVHPNPFVGRTVHSRLGDLDNVILTEPLEYIPFVWLLTQAAIVLTDSGGIQEEAPALGKPVLVMRDKTERPEGVEAGSARLVGADRRRIIEECTLLLENPAAYNAMARSSNPYGDGHASRRIADRIAAFLEPEFIKNNPGVHLTEAP